MEKLTTSQLKDIIRKYKKKNCPAFSRLRKAELISLVNELGLDITLIPKKPKEPKKPKKPKPDPEPKPEPKPEPRKLRTFDKTKLDYDSLREELLYYTDEMFKNTFPLLKEKDMLDIRKRMLKFKNLNKGNDNYAFLRNLYDPIWNYGKRRFQWGVRKKQ